MKRTEQLLLTFLNLVEVGNVQVKESGKWLNYRVSDSDLETLKKFNLINKDNELTSFGRIYEPLPSPSGLNNKPLEKGLTSMLSEFSKRIDNEKITEVGQDLLNELETLQLILQAHLNPISDERIEAYYSAEIEEGTQLTEIPAEIIVHAEKVKKSRKRV